MKKAKRRLRLSSFVLLVQMVSHGAFAQTPTTAPSTVAAPSDAASIQPPATPSTTAAGADDSKLTPPIWQNTDTSFLKQYPHLRDNVYQEPDAHFRFGLSAGLLGLVASRQIFSGNFFQVHYITERLDIEGFSVSYAQTTARPSGIRSVHFVFRSVPKYRLTRAVSIGPLLGYEFVSFPDVSAVLLSPQSKVTQPEPFSTAGFIYGLSIAETFKLESGLEIRLTQVGYKETYSVTDAAQGWSYLYASRDLRTDSSPLAAGSVILLEAGILF